MKLFEWDDSLNINIEHIDSQHKNLFIIINAYFSAMKSAKANEVLSDTVDKLLKYAEVHFKAEEEYFVKYNYPHANEHVKEHSYYLEKIASYQTMIKEGVQTVDGSIIAVDLWKFMKGWLVNHIMVDDMKYRDYFLATGDIKPGD